MRIHIVTIGQPKLLYAKEGWEQYFKRMGRFHDIRVTHIADKRNDAKNILGVSGKSTSVVLEIGGTQYSSVELSDFLDKRASEGKELSFIIGGPEGLPQDVIGASDYQWSLSKLTFPHDLAMVVLLEALYRASTINAGAPYHK